MSHTSFPARLAATVAASTLGAALAAGSAPAAAATSAQPYPDPSGGAVVDTPRVDTGAARNRIETPRVDVGRLLNEIEGPPASSGRTATPPVPQPDRLVVDDGSLEPVQLLVGVLAGALLVGGAGSFAARRRHGQPHPL
jgi:hypothetical protein